MKSYILIGIIIVAVIVAGYFISPDKQKTQHQEIKLCEKHKSGPELSPGDLYCGGAMCLNTCDENGENCHRVTDKEECEKLDVITTDGNNEIIIMGQDGDPDCEWDSLYGCKPSK